MVQNITANCVSIIFEDDSFLTAHWSEVQDLLLFGRSQRAVAIRVFHQQSSAEPPVPSNELQFTADGPFEVDVIGLKSLGTGSQLLVRSLVLAPGQVREDIFRDDFSQDINIDLGSTAIEALMGVSDVMFRMYSIHEVDWLAKVIAALTREDLGPCV